MSTYDEIDRLIEEAIELPVESSEAVRLYEQAIRIADAGRDLDAVWDLRLDLINRIMHTSDWDRFFMHFAWCLTQNDRDPSRFPSDYLLWYYKWAIANGAEMPEIGKARLLGLLDDMRTRHRADGSTLRAFHAHRAWVAVRLGDLDSAKEAFSSWQDTPRDHLSDCRACELEWEARFLVWFGETDAALELVERIVTGPDRCVEVPRDTYGTFLLDVHRVDPERAKRYHREGRAQIRDAPDSLRAHAGHLLYAALQRRDEEALRIIGRHLHAATNQPAAWQRMFFLRAVSRTCELWRERGKGAMTVTLPQPSGAPEEIRDIAQLGEWAGEAARRLAAAFDARNGNRTVSSWIDKWPG